MAHAIRPKMRYLFTIAHSIPRCGTAESRHRRELPPGVIRLLAYNIFAHRAEHGKQFSLFLLGNFEFIQRAN